MVDFSFKSLFSVDTWIQLDMTISMWVHSNLSCVPLDYLMRFFTLLGDGGIFFVLVGLGMMVFRKTRLCGVIVLINIIVASLLTNFVFKPIFDRVRPYELWNMVILTAPPHGSSFPSGHTTLAFAFAFPLRYYFKGIGAAAIIVAVMVGFSRIYLMVHYFTDVMIGILVAYVCYRIVRYLYYHHIDGKIKWLLPLNPTLSEVNDCK